MALPMIKELCPFGCIFNEKGKLNGDCRIPWSKECYLNKIVEENKTLKEENKELLNTIYTHRCT